MPGLFDVEIIRTALADFPDLSQFDSVLSDDERERADRYRIQESRDTFTLARGLLRIELARRLNATPRDVQFDVRPSGKPDLRPSDPRRPDWCFSVSHTGSDVAIAFALGRGVGVDIERLDRQANPLGIAKRYFTPRELQSLEATPAPARTRAFFAGWTRKEAIVKARGSTMSESLTTLSVDLDPEALHPHFEDEPGAPPGAECRLTTFEFPERNLIGAVALCSNGSPRLRFEVLSVPRFD